MKNRQTKVFGVIIVVCILLAAAGLMWLANAHVTPPSQTVNQVLPDDHIPH